MHKLVKATVIAVLLLLGAASPASAATTVLRTNPGNTQLPPNSIFTASSGSGTISSNLGSIGCTAATLTATVAVTHGNPSVTAQLVTMTFGTCTDTFPSITVTTCQAVSPLPTVTVTAGAAGGTVSLSDVFVRCNFSGTTTACYSTAGAPAVGNLTNSNSTLVYANVSSVYSEPFGTTNGFGSGTCGGVGFFSADFVNLHTGAGKITVTTT